MQNVAATAKLPKRDVPPGSERSINLYLQQILSIQMLPTVTYQHISSSMYQLVFDSPWYHTNS